MFFAPSRKSPPQTFFGSTEADKFALLVWDSHNAVGALCQLVSAPRLAASLLMHCEMVRRISVVVTALVVVVTAFSGCQRAPATSAVEHLRRGDDYLANKKLPEALIEYQAAVGADPRNGQARLQLGRAFAASGNTVKAMEQLVRAADLLPQDARAQTDAARALLAVGRFEDAGSRAARVLERDPTHVDAHVLRAAATAGLKDVTGAIETLEEAIRLDPHRSGIYLDLATLRAVQGQQPEAEAGFKQAIAVAPNSIEAHLALGNYYWLVRRVKDAENTLLNALKIDLRDQNVNQFLANLYIVTGRPAEAEAPLRRVAEASDRAQPQITLADYYIRQRRPDEARRVLEGVAKRPEAAAAARSRLAAIEYEAGRRDVAHQLVDDLIREQPGNAQVLVVKGGWLLGERNIAEALRTAQAAVAADSNLADTHALLGAVHRVRNQSEEAVKAYLEALKLQPRAFGPRVALAHLYVSLGQGDRALALAREAVAAMPQSVDARFALARALFATGQLSEAHSEVQLVVDATPNAASVQNLLGRIEYRRGNATAARDAFTRALRLEPRSLEALAGLVNLDMAAKKREDATRRVEAAVAQTPDNASMLLLAGRTYALTGDLDKAEAALNRAIDVDPSLLEAYHVLGQLYVRQKRLDEARKAYEQRLTQRPNDVSVHTMLGMLLYVQGKPAEARARFEAALAIDSRAAVAANNLAYLDAEAGTNLDVALHRAQTAKAVLPEDPDVSDTLAWVYVKRNLPSMAMPLLEDALQKNPRNPVYHYHLGIAYLKNQDEPRAREALERALKLDPNFEGAVDARNALSSMSRISRR
jgi:tetratricopeptide (TPR) repeat protein